MGFSYTPRAQAAIEGAHKIALARGHAWVGVEHLLAALISTGPSIATAALGHFDVEVDALNAELKRRMDEVGS